MTEVKGWRLSSEESGLLRGAEVWLPGGVVVVRLQSVALHISFPSGRNPTPAIPFCCLTLTAPIPPDLACPVELGTAGNHIRKRRLDLGLLQREVAKTIGVDASSVCNWENGRCEPEFGHLPSIIRFLRYDSAPEGKALGQRVRRTRRALGLSQKKLGIDPSTVRDIEAEQLPGPRLPALVDAFLARNRR